MSRVQSLTLTNLSYKMASNNDNIEGGVAFKWTDNIDSQLVVIEAQIESPSSRTALAEAEFQTGYSSPTQDAIRKDLNLSLAEPGHRR
ncbi:hypothetical protein P8452_61494 [Trifolium repens]|nr:hypothetical protein P8452_61494 [Trifolium repens]